VRVVDLNLCALVRLAWKPAHHAALLEVVDDLQAELEDTEEGQQTIGMLPPIAPSRTEQTAIAALSLWELMEYVVKDDVASLLYADAADSLDSVLEAVPLQCPYLNVGDTLRAVAQRFPSAVWSRRYFEWADTQLSSVIQRKATPLADKVDDCSILSWSFCSVGEQDTVKALKRISGLNRLNRRGSYAIMQKVLRFARGPTFSPNTQHCQDFSTKKTVAVESLHLIVHLPDSRAVASSTPCEKNIRHLV
jgi:hypothetical protein